MISDTGKCDESVAQNERNSSEATLLAEIAEGNKNSFKTFYDLYYSRLYRFIARITSGDNIDEVINDTMFVVWNKAATYNGECAPSTWVFGIAYKKTLQSLRSKKRIIEESLDAMELESPLVSDPNCSIDQYELSNFLGKALENLTEEQRAVVELTYYQGLSYKEIAVLMDCSENTVKTRMFYARAKLSKTLQENEER